MARGEGSRVRGHASSTGCENPCTGSGCLLCAIVLSALWGTKRIAAVRRGHFLIAEQLDRTVGLRWQERGLPTGIPLLLLRGWLTQSSAAGRRRLQCGD